MTVSIRGTHGGFRCESSNQLSTRLQPLIQAYLNEKDPKRKELLSNSYQVLTGEDIEVRIALND